MAWRVLSDVLRHGDLAQLGPASFEQIVAWRLAQEAEQAGVAPAALAAAFASAMRELTGAERPASPDLADDPVEDDAETVDDL